MNYREAGIRDIEDGKIEFEVLPEHVKLLRNARVVWNDEGVGAPMIDVRRPYGTTAAMGDARDILDYHEDPVQLLQWHRGTAVALAIAIKTGKWKPGIYRCDKYDYNWTEYRPPKPKKVKHGSTEGDDGGTADDEAALPVCDGTQPALDL